MQLLALRLVNVGRGHGAVVGVVVGVGYAQVQKISYNVDMLGRQGVVVPVPWLVSILLLPLAV